MQDKKVSKNRKNNLHKNWMKRLAVHSVTLTISLVIISGFIVSGISSYFSFQSMFAKDLEAVSELTSENIYGNISSLMDRPISVSTTMAHDTFLRDFMNGETVEGLKEDNLDKIQKYLTSYQEKYMFDSVFFVSEKTKNYYHFKNGVDRVLTPDDEENVWYYDFLESPSECSLNVDNDQAKDNLVTIFVNCKLYDENNQVIGVVGVGLITPYIQQFLQENEAKFAVHAYLIDQLGNIQVSSHLTEFENINLFNDPDFSDMAAAIDTSQKLVNHRWYHSGDKDGYVITKYIPNLNWYLVVEKSTQEFRNKMLGQLGLNFVFMLCVVVIVIFISTNVLKKYDNRLKNLADMDQLTGIRNRTSYEREMLNYAQEVESYYSFSLGICDLNNLKNINDRYGHQVGDKCIQEFTAQLCAAFEHCPIFRIGGDEFVIVFKNMEEQKIIENWDKLLVSLKKFTEKYAGIPLSAAFGYDFWDDENLNTMEKLFKSADDKMYLNKKAIKKN